MSTCLSSCGNSFFAPLSPAELYRVSKRLYNHNHIFHISDPWDPWGKRRKKEKGSEGNLVTGKPSPSVARERRLSLACSEMSSRTTLPFDWAWICISTECTFSTASGFMRFLSRFSMQCTQSDFRPSVRLSIWPVLVLCLNE